MPNRTSTHGEYSDYCRVSRSLKDLLPHDLGRYIPTVTETYDQICGKIARIIVGQENFKDHWVDIRGYASCILKSLSIPTNSTFTYNMDYADEAQSCVACHVARGRAVYLYEIFKALSFLLHPDYRWTCASPWTEIIKLIDEYLMEFHDV